MTNPDGPGDDRVPRYVTVEEAAVLIGRDVQIIRRWIRNGWLPTATRLPARGRAFLIPTMDLFDAEISHPRKVSPDQRQRVERLHTYIKEKLAGRRGHQLTDGEVNPPE